MREMTKNFIKSVINNRGSVNEFGGRIERDKSDLIFLIQDEM